MKLAAAAAMRSFQGLKEVVPEPGLYNKETFFKIACLLPASLEVRVLNCSLCTGKCLDVLAINES